MKPTQITELIANIKGTFVSFFSILMFVALGVGIFLGISWSGPALQEAADRTFAEGAFHNFQVNFPYGLTKNDLEELSKVEGVSQVEGEYQSFQTVMVNGAKVSVKLQSIGNDIDKPQVVEGELPMQAGEIALHKASANTLGASVGDTVTFQKDAAATDEDGMSYLNGSTYKVTAIINSPEYIANASNTYGTATTPSGKVDALAWVPASAFDTSAFQDGYPLVNVRSESLDGLNTFSDDYKKSSKRIEERITNLGSTLAKNRYDDLRSQAQEKIDAAQSEIDEGKQKVADGEREVADGRAQLNAMRSQPLPGLDAAIAENEQRLADAEAQVESAKKELAESELKLKESQAELDDMDEFEWTVLPRKYNAGASQTSVFSDVTDHLAISMATLFIIVGLLVSYSAVSRIVHEQITQIGTKKALGLRAREITLSFLWYSGIAVLAGAIIGAIIATTMVEGIIGGVIGEMFSFGSYPPHFDFTQFLVVTAIELGLILCTTWLACRGILKKHAIELLHGTEPPQVKMRFYEKRNAWERLPLFTQTIVNNSVNDKRRVFSTIVGVAGCTALIVTAITLNNDVLKSYDKHYSDVYGFNAIAFVEADPDNAINDAEATLKDHGVKTAQALRQSFTIEEPGSSEVANIQLLVPQDSDTFSELYHVRSVAVGKDDLSQDGAWVSQAYASHLGAKVGDEITLKESSGAEHHIKILGFYDFWLTYHEMVMDRDFYEHEFDTDFKANVILSDTGNAAIADLESTLAKSVDGFDSMTDDKTYQYSNFATFSNVSSAVVAIYLALAVLMAVVVLLNLNVMFIDEKRRELIVLMINGFSVKDAKRYIYNDTIVLTIIGIVAGLVLGCIMGALTVGAVEPSSGVFMKDIDPMAVIIGVVGSAALAAIMSAIALRRIPRFELTDINKL